MLEKMLKIFKIHFTGTINLKDGTPLTIDGELATGVSVQIEVDGNIQPLPDGPYELETGEVIEVKDGKITAITEPKANEEPATPIAEAKTDPVPAAIPSDNKTTDTKTSTPNVEELTKTIADLDKRLKAIEDLIAADTATDEAAVKASNEKLEKLEKDIQTIVDKVTVTKPTSSFKLNENEPAYMRFVLNEKK